MDDKSNKFFEGMKAVIKRVFSVANSLAWILIYLFLMVGSMSSIWLLVRLFPKDAHLILSYFNPIATLIIQVIIILLGCVISLLIMYLLLKYIIHPLIVKSNIVNKERRNKFRQDLVNDIIKKLRKKKWQ